MNLKLGQTLDGGIEKGEQATEKVKEATGEPCLRLVCGLQHNLIHVQVPLPKPLKRKRSKPVRRRDKKRTR